MSVKRTGDGSTTAGRACTVIICTRNRRIELDACLQQLARDEYPNFTVLVVDNASDVPVADICARWGAHHMREPIIGLSRARNAGVRAAQGEVVVFTDDDALPEPGWLTALMREFDDPAVMVVTGRIRRFANTAGTGALADDEPAAVSWRARPRRTFRRSSPNWFAMACFGAIGDGGNMAFRRCVFDSWSGFDLRLGRGAAIDGGEEHLAFASLIDKGFAIAYAPDAVVRHPHHAVTDDECKRRYIDMRTSVGYICLLWHDFPRQRSVLARHLLGSMLRTKSLCRTARVLFHAWGWRAITEGVRVYVRTMRDTPPNGSRAPIDTSPAYTRQRPHD